jgi:hypothetical protein
LDLFTADFVKTLATPLMAHTIESATGRVRKTFTGGEKEQALQRCLHTGVVALLTTASRATPEEMDLLDDIFRSFFNDPRVGSEIGRLLRGSTLDMVALSDLFADAGYDATTLPALNFEQGMQAFETAFLLSAQQEPILQGIIRTAHVVWARKEHASVILASCCGEQPPSPMELLVMGWFGVGCGVLLLAQMLFFAFAFRRKRRASWQWPIATISAIVCLCAFVLAQHAFATYQRVVRELPLLEVSRGTQVYSQEQALAQAIQSFEVPTLAVVIVALALLLGGTVKALAED